MIPAMNRIIFGAILSAFVVAVPRSHAVEADKSRVVLVRDGNATDAIKNDAPRVQAMLGQAIQKLTGQRDEAAAWRVLVSSNDVVGIKINTQAAPLSGTHRGVVEAVARGLLAAGVAATNIVVWDRDPIKLRAAGYDISGSTTARPYRVMATAPDGWDPAIFYENKFVGRIIWGDWAFNRGEDDLSTRSHLPKLLTQTITKLINIPALQDHEAAGVAGCLYNVSLGMVDNNRRFDQYPLRSDPMIPEVYSLPAVRGKLVLNIMDALVPGYAGGPAFKPRYSWPYGGLYLSRDPVAIDTLCRALLDAKRREAQLPSIVTTASHIDTAGRAGLGQAQREQIDLIEIAP
jgi:hypothetical protein